MKHRLELRHHSPSSDAAHEMPPLFVHGVGGGVFPDTAHDVMLERDHGRIVERMDAWSTERGF